MTNHPDRSAGRKAELRQSVRYSVPSAQQKAKLKIAATAWQVRLVEISTTGFTVLVSDRLSQIRLTDVGELQTTEGKFEIRVVHVTEVGPDESTAQRQTTMLRLGLDRLRELSPPGKGPLAGAKPREHSARTPRQLSPGAMAALGTLAVLLIAVVPILVISDAQSPNHQMFRQMLWWGRGVLSADVEQQAASPAERQTNGAVAAMEPGEADRLMLQHLALSLPGPEPFAAPEIIRALHLSAAQQAKLHDLIETTVAALREFDQQWQHQNRQTHAKNRNQVLEAARQEALQIPTAPQRAQWMELTK